MIGASVNGHTRLHADLAPGVRAYVDAAWLPRRTGMVPALLIEDGRLRWSGDAGREHPLEGDADSAAGAALAAIARASAEAVRDVDGVRVDITGRGVVAEEVRNLLGVGARPAAQEPLAIIDTTGDPDEISGALGRVATLGKVVLAGPAATRKLDLDLYPDVHRRSLTVLGVSPRPRLDDLVPQSGTVSSQPATVRPSDDLPLDALWFCLVRAD